VYLKTAHAIVNQYDEAAIEQQLKYYRLVTGSKGSQFAWAEMLRSAQRL
jgi:hypothetical protein